MSESYYDAWDSTPPVIRQSRMTHFAFALVALLACARPASVQSIPVSRESGAPKSAIISDSHAGRVDPRQPAILFTQAKDEPARAVITDQAGNPPPTELPFGEAIYLSAIKSVKDGAVAWDIEPEDRAARAGYFEGGNVVCIPLGASKQPYTLVVRQYVAKGGTPAFAKIKINIGGTPTPEPKPDDPPKPPAPKPAGGLRVVVVRETGDAAKVDAVFAKSVRDYLKSKCAKDAKGNAEFRVWDDDQQFSESESYTLREIFQKAQPFQALPALIIQNDASPTAKAMPLPATPDDLLAELRKWGG